MLNLIRKYFPGLFSFLYCRLKCNKWDVQSGNSIRIINNALLKGCRSKIDGNGNVIEISRAKLQFCNIHVVGNRNKIVISDDCCISHMTIHLEDDDNNIYIGRNVQIFGPVHIAAIEGTNIWIGDDCLFSQNVNVRSGDSHSVIDSASEKRINWSRSIAIGPHVWVGHSAMILKGATIGQDCVIAAGAIVVGKQYPNGSIIGGNPAKVIRENITWDANRK